jgi:hypothetical protein
MVIERYSHVMHIVSNVEGRLKPGLDAVDVLKASFPAGTVTGAPKVRAMQIIDELESVKRGVYSGAVGYLGFNGDMDVAIAIRTRVRRTPGCTCRQPPASSPIPIRARNGSRRSTRRARCCAPPRSPTSPDPARPWTGILG